MDPPAIAQKLPSEAALGAALDAAARARRLPTILLRALAWKESRWQVSAAPRPGRAGLLGVPTEGRADAARLESDWCYNISEGARHLELMWNRAPILGNGHLEDGRNILECWWFALGRYGAGVQGAAADAYAAAVFDAVKEKCGVTLSRPDREKLSWGRNAWGPPAPWHFGDVAPRPAATAVVDLEVPYVMQVWDTPEDFDGTGACGPCALEMALSFLERRGGAPGPRIPEIYRAVCEPGRGAIHQKMLDYCRPRFPGVALFYNEKASWQRVKAELDAGRPVLLGSRVTPAGHIMVVRGYLSDGRLIVNDPAGDRERAARRDSADGPYSPTGARYWNGGGRGARYDWDALSVRWVMTFGPKTDGSDPPEDGGR